MSNRLNPLEDLGDLFVNRDSELEKFWMWATGVPHPGRNSYALVGLRRTGKTAILHKLFNNLFYEQGKVLPVYISFADYLYRTEPITVYEFAEEFFLGYMRSYLAFRYRKPELLSPEFDRFDLSDFAQQVQDELALNLYTRYERAVAKGTPYGLMQWVINFPRGVARTHRIPMAMIIDEFQILTKVYNPQNGRTNALTDRFQKASETKWAPLLVSGSAISLLVEDALGGMLSGRFKTHILKPLTREHTHNLVFRLAASYGLTVNEEFAEAIWLLTEGYPYSIESLISSDSPHKAAYPDLSALIEVYLFELSNPQGQLWTHYSREFGKYSHELNEGLTTRRVMLWATKYPGKRIDAEHIAEELKLDVSQVRASLEKLNQVDVVRKIGLISYQGPSDPIMRRYIEYQHLVEIDKLAPAEAKKDWKKEYKSLEGHVNRHKGAMAEVHIGAVMGRFDGRELDGSIYFNHAKAISLPKFEQIKNREGIVKDGIAIEIDLIGLYELEVPSEAPAESEEEPQNTSQVNEEVDDKQMNEALASEDAEAQEAKESPAPTTKKSAWLVQVKYTQEKMGLPEIQQFLKQVAAMTKENNYYQPQAWYVSKGGFTKSACKLLEQAGILYSERTQFNQLANLFGFFGLPA